MTADRTLICTALIKSNCIFAVSTYLKSRARQRDKRDKNTGCRHQITESCREHYECAFVWWVASDPLRVCMRTYTSIRYTVALCISPTRSTTGESKLLWRTECRGIRAANWTFTQTKLIPKLNSSANANFQKMSKEPPIFFRSSFRILCWSERKRCFAVIVTCPLTRTEISISFQLVDPVKRLYNLVSGSDLPHKRKCEKRDKHFELASCIMQSTVCRLLVLFFFNIVAYLRLALTCNCVRSFVSKDREAMRFLQYYSWYHARSDRVNATQHY